MGAQLKYPGGNQFRVQTLDLLLSMNLAGHLCTNG